MAVFVLVGIILIVGMSYYLSRRSNRKAAAQLSSGATPNRRRSLPPEQLARFEQQRAEHLMQAQGAQTDNQIGGSFG